MYEPEAIPQVWDEVSALLAECFEESRGMLNERATLQWILDKWATVFSSVQGNKITAVIVIMPVQYAEYKVARIIACGGKDLKGSFKFIDALDAWALMQGCVEIEGWCRPVVARLVRNFGLKHKLAIVSRDLRRKLQ